MSIIQSSLKATGFDILLLPWQFLFVGGMNNDNGATQADIACAASYTRKSDYLHDDFKKDNTDVIDQSCTLWSEIVVSNPVTLW